MAKPDGTGYSPLSWYDRLKLRAAAKHLHSRYASVRAAAHAEIKRILQKRRGLKTRVQNGRARLKDRIVYGRLDRCDVAGCNHETRDKAMAQAHVRKHQREVIPKAARERQPSRPVRAPSPADTGLSERDLRERQRARKAQAAAGAPQAPDGRGRQEDLAAAVRSRAGDSPGRGARPAPAPEPAGPERERVRPVRKGRAGIGQRPVPVAPDRPAVRPLPAATVEPRVPRARKLRIPKRARHPLGRSRA